MFRKLKEKLGFFENCTRMASLDYGDGNYSNSGEVLKDNNYSYPKKPAKKIRTTTPEQDDKYYAEEIEKAEEISRKTICVVVLCTILGSTLLVYLVWLLLKFLYSLPITMF